MKKRFKKFIAILKEFKFEVLMTFEVIALVFAAIYYAFGRKKQFSFLTAVSALLGAYISTSALYKVNSKMKSRKYIDIIATANKNSDVIDNEDNLDEDDELVFELEDDGIIEDND
ncbi:MAG: hypothetical protein J6A53_01355 [Clostridia bacterium]|nr:hypothetical protein [Clostridia bacterium]